MCVAAQIGGRKDSFPSPVLNFLISDFILPRVQKTSDFTLEGGCSTCTEVNLNPLFHLPCSLRSSHFCQFSALTPKLKVLFKPGASPKPSLVVKLDLRSSFAIAEAKARIERHKGTLIWWLKTRRGFRGTRGISNARDRKYSSQDR